MNEKTLLSISVSHSFWSFTNHSLQNLIQYFFWYGFTDVDRYLNKTFFSKINLIFHVLLFYLSFRNELYKKDTELSNELWQIKMKNCTPEITWRIIRNCFPYNYNSRKCYEKVLFMFQWKTGDSKHYMRMKTY